MKKLINILAISIILSNYQFVFAAGSCPSVKEMQTKSNYFRQQVNKLQSSNNKSSDAAYKILQEMMRYNNNNFYGCVQYFKTTDTPDCERVSTLLSGYYSLDRTKQLAGKNQLKQLLPKMNSKCPVAGKMIERHIKN